MNLSGKLIKGTGSYSIGEIAPPSAVGDVLAGIGAFTTWAGVNDPNDYPIGWTLAGNNATNYISNLNGSVSCIISGGENLRIYKNTITSGKYYKVSGNISGLSGNPATNYISFTASGGVPGPGLVIISDNGKFEGFLLSSTTIFLIGLGAATNGAILDNVIIEEFPEGYPLMDKGTKYSECTSAGTVAIPSDIAYGSGEFDVYKKEEGSTITIYFISDKVGVYPDVNAYFFRLDSAEAVRLMEYTGAAVTIITKSADSYVKNNTWYRIKWDRTLDGEFHLYVKGGVFGNNGWTLVDVTGGGGSNPSIDTSHTESQYFVLDLNVGDRFANLTIKNLVRQ